MLSSLTTHEPAAAVTQDSVSFGGFRSGTEEGSTSSTSRLVVVDLAVPCSPNRDRMGCGMSGFAMAAISHARTSGLSASETLIWDQSSPKTYVVCPDF